MNIYDRLRGADEIAAREEAPELSREDLYEGAVRAVLDLCEAEDARAQEGTTYVATALISSREIRKAISSALSGAGPAAVEEAPC